MRRGSTHDGGDAALDAERLVTPVRHDPGEASRSLDQMGGGFGARAASAVTAPVAPTTTSAHVP